MTALKLQMTSTTLTEEQLSGPYLNGDIKFFFSRSRIFVSGLQKGSVAIPVEVPILT